MGNKLSSPAYNRKFKFLKSRGYMSLYNNFIGIDIGKFNFVTSIYGKKATTEYENSSKGYLKFIEEHRDILNNSLVIIEATGGCELEFIYTMLSLEYKVHRADSRKVKNFIRSFGGMSKTDSLDAKALGKYGHERWKELPLFVPSSKTDIELFQLVQRREDLISILVAEKNRLESAKGVMVKKTIKTMIKTIEKQIDSITKQINDIIDNSPELKQKLEILKTIPGIGNIIAFDLLILLPELGKIDRRKIAALAGVAPRSNDSGKFIGYRRTGHGRSGIKRMLFLAAMAARRSNTNLKEFYEKLISNGKKKMVALTALMRKILVIANAKIRDCLVKA
jgi:transposase